MKISLKNQIFLFSDGHSKITEKQSLISITPLLLSIYEKLDEAENDSGVRNSTFDKHDLFPLEEKVVLETVLL